MSEDKLNDAASKQLTQGAALKVDNLQAEAEPFLTDKAKEALKNFNNGLTLTRYGSDGLVEIYGQCLYICSRVKLDKVEDGIKEVAETINKLAEDGKIISALSHFIKFDLSPESSGYFKPLEVMVLCYVHVDVETYNKLSPIKAPTSGDF
jgi:hypothetical protein